MTSRLKPPLNDGDHILGDPTAPAQLVEYGDYECPFCGKAHPIVKALQNALGERMVYAFRHFPLAGSHPHAVLAAEAAEAAGAQGRFWEMHDTLYTHQDALTLPDLQQYAFALDLDLAEFERDLRTHRHLDTIRADLHSGAISGVNGTPTFFINGLRHDGAWDFESLYEAIAGRTGVEVPG